MPKSSNVSRLTSYGITGNLFARNTLLNFIGQALPNLVRVSAGAGNGALCAIAVGTTDARSMTCSRMTPQAGFERSSAGSPGSGCFLPNLEIVRTAWERRRRRT